MTTTTVKKWVALPAGVQDEKGHVLVYGISKDLAERIAVLPELEERVEELAGRVKDLEEKVNDLQNWGYELEDGLDSLLRRA